MQTIHGHARKRNRTPEYSAWVSMRARCSNIKHPEFKNYGGRGIYVCERWGTFQNFINDMGVRPSSQHSLDRIDVNGPYSPENCRWASNKEQCRNMRKTVVISAFGRTQSLPAWADELGITQKMLRTRIERGWDAEKALTPLSGRKRTSTIYTINGLSLSATEWANRLKIPAKPVLRRLYRGWEIERALGIK